LIYGERDPFVPGGDVALLYRRAGEPKELWRVPEAAHRDIHLHRPDEYRQKIIHFFERALT
jgi:fermentation-respiration switch protein FrsA (DUF1100 family)